MESIPGARVGASFYRDTMTLTRPTQEQRVLLDAIVAASDDLAPALAAQFADALVTHDQCPICFDLAVSTDAAVTDISRARLARLESPLTFDAVGVADTSDEDEVPTISLSLAAEPGDPPSVLVWHTGGIVSSIEIMWHEGEHPELNDLELPLVRVVDGSDIA